MSLRNVFLNVMLTWFDIYGNTAGIKKASWGYKPKRW